MPKVMIFIDGTWLYCNTSRLGYAYGRQDFHLDFGKLPRILAEEVGRQLGYQDIDVVRTFLFGSYATNCDPQDEEARQRRLDFFTRLREDYHYELEIYPINFLGRRLKRTDRDPSDPFEPREKCVDISLAAQMIYFAAIPNAYDVAIAVVGDQDFKPVLQSVRRLGKRVAIASIKGSCAPEFSDPRDEAKVKDLDLIWLDDFIPQLELRYEEHVLQCESPMHKGDPHVWTTFHPRKGQQFFCEVCREEFARLKQELQREASLAVGSDGEPYRTEAAAEGDDLRGTIVKKVSDRGFGFIKATDGRDYFFHLADLAVGLDFNEVQEGLPVMFAVKRQATAEKGGTAQNIRRLLDVEAAEST